MCEWNALFGSLVRDGTEHTHIGGYGIMAPPFTEQPVFVLLDEAGGEICKSDGTVADEAEKAVHCTGISTGCTVSSGLFCPLYQGSGKIMYSIHNLNFNILNTYKTTLSMK